MQFSSAYAFHVALSTLIFPLRQPIRPFAANKAFSGPLYTAIGSFSPVPLPRSGDSGVVCAVLSVPPVHVVSKNVTTDKLTTANGGTFTSSSASLRSQSR